MENLHSLLGTKSNKNLTEKILSHAKTDLEKIEVANSFNDFFTGIGNTLAAQLPDSNVSPIFPSDNNCHNFFLFPPSHEEILKIISKLKLTSTSKDILPVKLLKKFSNILVFPITLLIENSIQKGIFPDKLKIA